jgi:hypothetical protein
LVKVEENKRIALFRNPDRTDFKVTKVDGCLIRKGARCDYLVVAPKVASVFVELKGADVSLACDQLFATAAHEDVRPLVEGAVGFLVVCSRYPRFDSFVARAKQMAAKRYKAGFHVVTDRGEFDAQRVAAINGPK